MIEAIVLGLVEGITEFLPISSTGHLLIAEHLLGSHKSDAFNVLIQVGPILAAALVFWKHIADLCTGFWSATHRDELIKLAASFVLTGIGGLALKAMGLELPDHILPIAIATLIGAGVIWLVERTVAKRTSTSEHITWTIAIAVAGAQLLAAGFPGTSRSGAVVMIALALGLSRPAAVRFAFLVGIPTMLAAGSKQILDTIQDGHAADLLATETLVAFVVASLSAFVAVRWLLRYVQSSTFLPFAWYRLLMGIALVIAWATGWMA